MTTPKSSLRDQVFQTLRNDILSGKYQPGDEIVESTIGKKLGVSRTPVREAIRQLQLEGLVELIPNKGTIIKGISIKDVRDIYQIRSKLEGLCAAWAARYRTEEELEKLEETVFLSKYHAQKEHYDQVFELDSRFHEILYEASHSNILAHTLVDYHQYVQRARKLTIANRIRSKSSNEEHENILEAVREQDEKKAEELATQHILNTILNMEQFDIEKILHAESSKQ